MRDSGWRRPNLHTIIASFDAERRQIAPLSRRAAADTWDQRRMDGACPW